MLASARLSCFFSGAVLRHAQPTTPRQCLANFLAYIGAVWGAENAPCTLKFITNISGSVTATLIAVALARQKHIFRKNWLYISPILRRLVILGNVEALWATLCLVR